MCVCVCVSLCVCVCGSDELRSLRDDYLAASPEDQRFMEQRFGKRVIQRAVEESYSREWLSDNCKCCPRCGTNIQVSRRAAGRKGPTGASGGEARGDLASPPGQGTPGCEARGGPHLRGKGHLEVRLGGP